MKTLEFPDGFLWGSATAAHQVEGGNSQNDWWQWEHSEQRLADLKKQNKNPEDYQSGIACDSYSRYEEDFDLLVQLNQNAHRLSIEWARVEPEPGVFSEIAIAHYRKVLESLKRRNVKVFLTLHHFTNPVWFLERGGWQKIENLQYFLQFAERVFKEYSDLLDFVCVINEPNIYAGMSYQAGNWPPQRKDFFATQSVMKNMTLAHQQVYKKLKPEYKNVQIGTAYHISKVELQGWLKIFKPLVNYIWYHQALGKVAKYADFIGINYYSRQRLEFQWKPPFLNKMPAILPVTDFDWEIYPQGFYELLLDLKQYNKPIYITENGLADADDDQRADFIRDHVAALHRAIQNRVNVRGYLHWSLLDNFEWAEGFTKEFGLVHIDRKNNLQRVVRPSALYYAEICKTNKLETS